jgi:heat shock protein HtpX
MDWERDRGLKIRIGVALALVALLPVAFAYAFVFAVNAVGLDLLARASERPYNGRVYVDSLGGLSALDPADGAVRWRVGNRSLSAGPFLAPSGVLVVAESDLVCHYREDTF